VAQLRQPDTVLDGDAYQLHPGLLDSCFQLLAVTFPSEGEEAPWLLWHLAEFRLHAPCPPGTLWCYAKQVESEAGRVVGEIQLFDEAGQLIAELIGFELRQASASAPQGWRDSGLRGGWQAWLYEVEWQPQARFEPSPVVDYLPPAHQISESIEKRQPALFAAEASDVFHQLEALSVDYILNALHEMGETYQSIQGFSSASLALQLGIVPQQKRLFARLLEILADEVVPTGHDITTEVVHAPTKRLKSLRLGSAERAELTLLKRCGSRLAELLRGECDPLDLLFPDGDLTLLTAIYRDSPEAEAINTIVREALLTAQSFLPIGRGMRVLEIGAGTGGTTAYLLPHLDPERTEYTFSDISSLFIAKAQETFADYAFMRYQPLDIEQAPEGQGFTPHQYDLIIAANVLHATRDLRVTLSHVHQLLAPGGMLVLVEATSRQRWLDLTFGLTEGWWGFEDFDLRPNHPLLSIKQWQELLQESGFSDVASQVNEPVALEGSQDSKGEAQQAVILSIAAPFYDRENVAEGLMAIDIQKKISDRSNDFSRSGPAETTEVVTTVQKDYLNIYISPQGISRGTRDWEGLRGGSHWLILAEGYPAKLGSSQDFERGLGEQLASLLATKGIKSTLAFAGTTYKKLPSGNFCLDPSNPAHFEQLLGEPLLADLQHIVQMWPLESSTELTISSLERATTLGSGSSLLLLQALTACPLGIKQGLPAAAKLWFITRGTQPIVGATLAVAQQSSISQASLWGIGKTIALEHPDLWGGLIDLAPQTTPEDDSKELAALLDEIWYSPAATTEKVGAPLAVAHHDKEIAFRNGQRYVPRLKPLRVDDNMLANEQETWQINAESTYLITGGLGTLGLKVADFLVKEGARHLILMGRSKPASLSIIKPLEEQGAQIYIAQADVTKEADMRRLLVTEAAERPPLRGIVHTAAVFGAGYQLLAEMSLEDLNRVLAPKVIGTALLHQLTSEMEMDFFVCFSSMVSIWGSKGQANYVAANQFLDMFAHYARGMGHNVLSVNWGLWAESEQTLLQGDFGQLWGATEMGVNLLKAKPAFEALKYLLKAGHTQTTVADVDWHKYKPLLESKGKLPLLADIATARSNDFSRSPRSNDFSRSPRSNDFSRSPRSNDFSRSPSRARIKRNGGMADPFIQQFNATRLNERQELLRTHIQEQLRQVLGPIEQLDSEQGFFDMGMDSLMAIDLRNRLQKSLGISLRSTLAFDFPTIETLAEHLGEELSHVLSEGEADEENYPEEEFFDAAYQVSEDEADLLAESLAEVEALLGLI
jgi:NAD(P)-dependent dehydrogenase (short-subunit alcohol dehydrogenase family)/SAM-dependent methyltransferase/acyl carrier protein